jgi:hypothetical protein
MLVSLQNPNNPDRPETKFLEEFLEKLPPTPKEPKKNRFNLLNCLLSPTSFFLKEKRKEKKNPLRPPENYTPFLSSPLTSSLVVSQLLQKLLKKNESLKPCSSCCLRYVFSPCNTKLVL